MNAEKELIAPWAERAASEATSGALSPKAAALQELVHQHRERVYRVARQLVGSHEDADDIAQEVFCRAYQALDRFRGEAALTTWLYRMTVNAALNLLRARERRRRFLSRWTRHRESNVSGRSPHPLEAEELREQVRRALEALPARLRAVAVLVEMEGLSAPEVARILEIPEGTVRSRLYYARRRLRESLRPYLEAESGEKAP